MRWRWWIRSWWRTATDPGRPLAAHRRLHLPLGLTVNQGDATSREFLVSIRNAGDCHDIAVAESFSGTLEIQLFYDRPIPRTHADARAGIHDYIEKFYNREQRHSTIGYVSPAEFEARYHESGATSAA